MRSVISTQKHRLDGSSHDYDGEDGRHHHGWVHHSGWYGWQEHRRPYRRTNVVGVNNTSLQDRGHPVQGRKQWGEGAEGDQGQGHQHLHALLPINLEHLMKDRDVIRSVSEFYNSNSAILQNINDKI